MKLKDGVKECENGESGVSDVRNGGNRASNVNVVSPYAVGVVSLSAAVCCFVAPQSTSSLHLRQYVAPSPPPHRRRLTVRFVFVEASRSTFTEDIRRIRKDWESVSLCDEYLCQGELPNFIADNK
ncbi:O-fucosyltransferase 5 [Camellia lanceoleosa]|uniref:O-fucosyltransferase 5 n=1 Tax=Camellia lanceoleosa TaxID=1840588 RepID=A0ACC0HPK2_9ERIC|nr:O-fucosyltransferase 5 [Camellia lanceoleosa]